MTAPIDPAVPAVAIVSATGDLDDAAAARLLHWCETRLHLLDIGRAITSHLVVDVSHARRAPASAVAILDHARSAADRRHVGIHLVGAGAIMAGSSPQARRGLARWSAFPTLDVASAALNPPAGDGRSTGRPVDPDAIVLTPTTPHDRLG